MNEKSAVIKLLQGNDLKLGQVEDEEDERMEALRTKLNASVTRQLTLL